MLILLEVDGALLDVAPLRYRAYRETANAVGWSVLVQADYWRLVRTKSREAPILPGAPPSKIKDFHARCEVHVEAESIVNCAVVQPWADASLRVLRTHATLVFFTLGSNAAVRRAKLESFKLLLPRESVECLDPDPRRRPAQIKELSGSERRSLLVASTDSAIRAAGEAGIFSVGLSCGSCAMPRLHAAGADVVFKDLPGLLDTLEHGGEELVRAGLMPRPLG